MRTFTLAVIAFLLAACSKTPNDALLGAASSGDVPGMVQALEKGANLNYLNKEGYDALRTAAEGDHAEGVRLLLKLGARIRKTSKAMSAPEIAASRGYNDVLALFFKSGLSPKWKTSSGGTLLHAAADGGGEKTVRFLVKKGVPVNATARDGNTPLFTAVGLNHKEIVKALLAARANPNIKNKSGNCPLTLALAEHRHEIVAELRAHGARPCK